MKKIQVKIENRVFNISVDEEFASFLEKDLQTLLDASVKDLLSLYLQKSYEIFSAEKKINNFLEKEKLEQNT